MNRQSRFSFWWIPSICPVLTCFLILPAGQGMAQVVPDATLATPSIVSANVNVNGALSDRIDGGVLRGSNLFHSFKSFDIETGRRVFFSVQGASSIFSRVTGGGLPSKIDGTLGVETVDAPVNLFLIHPNGIIFGAGSSLSVKGSLVVTTANSVLFDQGGVFSTSNPTASSVLNIGPDIQVPIGLQFEGIPKDIEVNGLNEKPVGFVVNSNHSFSLIGGSINLNAGYLNTFGGQVDLVAVGDMGIVGLKSERLNLDSSTILQRANIFLTDGTTVRSNGGNINILGKEVHIGKEAYVEKGKTGPQASGLYSTDLGDGNTGDIIINAQRLSVKDGGQISASNFLEENNVSKTGRGKAGNIFITAQDSVDVDGTSTVQFNPGTTGSLLLPSGIFSFSENNQPPGNVTISTKNLIVQNGASISTSKTQNQKIKNPAPNLPNGNIKISAQSVKVVGNSDETRGLGKGPIPVLGNGSRIRTITEGDGVAGEVTIQSDQVYIEGAARIDTRTTGQGKAGDITIIAKSVEAINGGQIISTTKNEGNGGTISITATDRITLSGEDKYYVARESFLNKLFLDKLLKDVESRLNDGPLSGFVTRSKKTSTKDPKTGVAGNLILNTQNLLIQDGAQISAQAVQGTAGNLQITAKSIDLRNGKLTSSTDSGDGGNITLNVEKLLWLKQDSVISTTAGSLGAPGNGGGITINAKPGFIIALPSKKGEFGVSSPPSGSDITADAFSGAGGKISISSKGIFGLVTRSRLDWKDPKDINPGKSSTNDVTAISLQNPSLDGQVAVNTNILGGGITQIPQEPRSTEVADSCQVSNGQESVRFFDIGRGGLPPRPEDPLSADLLEWATPSTEARIIPKPLSPDTTSPTKVLKPDRLSQTFQPSTATLNLLPPCQSH
jgi:filamentous hemagglutinin family protein